MTNEGATTMITTLTLSATFVGYDPTRPQSFSATTDQLAGEDEAREMCALFPKTLRAHAHGVVSHREPTAWYVRISASLASNGTTGAVNETSQRRIRSLYRFAARNDIELTWDDPAYGNSYETRAEFEQAAGLTD